MASRAIASAAAVSAIASASAARGEIDEAVITDRASIADRLAATVVCDARPAQRDRPALVEERDLDASCVRAALCRACVPAWLSVGACACAVCTAKAIAPSRARAPAHVDRDEHVAGGDLFVRPFRVPVHARSVPALAAVTRADERIASRASEPLGVISATLAWPLLPCAAAGGRGPEA
jgi:hypothetical protein